ncbi:hypothetical protein BH09DEP1_BH09DEP1_5480 [soil metagenome]
MKRIILAFCILNTFIAIAMDAPIKRSSSSGRTNTLLARHQRQSSLGEKVFASLNLKTDKTEDFSRNLDALVTNRRSPEQSLPQESPKSSDSLARSNLQNLIEKAGDNNRRNYIKMAGLAFEAIRNIKSVGDIAYRQYLSHLRYAEHYYFSLMSLEITKDSRAIETMAEEEFKQLKDTFNEKIASVIVQKK